ncbi:SDR family NAD(P)-dependent oxidoreductase [Allonocardiopsis opalescens]|uniref:Short-subunit dehydrogenase n=1 Tax=Allonocardiopsis opalescens TaxID=1144618 RepID=A0A2T0QF17_9ACTN|nr:SDR family NAD(P)-dependent oxidoreductase [Allonocardiopsis opalescens]PRY02443.1 short-subunit dehydrogenase [Allonocardiopsis opalescens]
MRDIAGATLFVTGGAQGIGLGIARAFARAGARIALADIDRERLAEAERELSALTDELAGFELDVCDRDAFARVADAAEERLGPVSVLCSNAGVGSALPPSALSYRVWDHVLGTNLGGAVNGLQTFLPRMLDRGGPAHIVNVASGAGLVASDKVPYVTAKSAVVGLSESLRRHAEPAACGIGVTVVCPGFVRTGIMANSLRREPGAAGPRDAAGEARDRIFERYGLPPDLVGEQVLHAVREDLPYVHTDRMLAGAIQERTRALLDAMPPETERDRRIAAALDREIMPLVGGRSAPRPDGEDAGRGER